VQGSLDADSGEATFDLAVTDVAPLVPGLSGPATAIGTVGRTADGRLSIDAEATGPGAQVTLDATVAPPAEGSEITGTADVAIADLSLLSPFVGQPLSGGFTGTVSGSLLPDLSGFDLALDGTTTDLSAGNAALASLLAGTGAISAEASRDGGGAIILDRLAADFPNIGATAQGTSQGDTTTVSFDTTLADLGLFVPDLPGPVTASGTATLSPAGTTVDAQVTGPGGIEAQLSGPIGATNTDLSISGTAPLALANTFLGPRRLGGTASYDLRLSGTPSLDGLSGTVSVEGAQLADPNLGEAVTGIDGTATIAGGVATLSLTGDLATGGSLAVSGPVSLSPPFDADLSITGTGLVIRDPALYEARGDARLTVTGPLTGGALIAGVADLSTVELRVPSSGVGALGELPNVFHIEPSLPVAETLRRADLSVTGEALDANGEAQGDEGGAGFALNILLNAPNQVFVRGRGLDAELGGQLRLTGSTSQVIPIGQFSLLRGRLSILGQRFELTEGSATLQGDFNPFLRLVATTESRSGTQISVILEGPLASPTVTFESTPELPQDEVLAQLLFGVDIESITPFQAIQLASAVAELAGGGAGLVDELRSGAGLADFDVTTTESGNVALRLGQYISENVYTDVVVSPEETEATINLDLSPDLTVRAGVSTEGETTLGIFFERDY
jgi:autotransporter translocation and assembly factor TamB